jgi:hypothetical protein
MFPSKLFKFEHDFFTLIEHVQSLTNLINKDMDVRDASGILRYLHQGFTSHTKNIELPKKWIKNMMNRWRTESNSWMWGPWLDMSDVYAALGYPKPLLLRITQWF